MCINALIKFSYTVTFTGFQKNHFGSSHHMLSQQPHVDLKKYASSHLESHETATLLSTVQASFLWFLTLSNNMSSVPLV